MAASAAPLPDLKSLVRLHHISPIEASAPMPDLSTTTRKAQSSPIYSPSDNLLVLCRHGQSETNAANTFTGSLDPPLTPLGESEARRVGHWLASVPASSSRPFDACFTSPQVRASRTAELILSVLGQTPPVFSSRSLSERDYGDLNGRNKDDVAREYGIEQTNAWRRSYDAVPPNGESLAMTCDRVMRLYDAEILPRLRRGESILVVTSGNTARGLVMRLENLNKDEVRKLQLGTAATRQYRIDPQTGGVKSKEVLLIDGMEGGQGA